MVLVVDDVCGVTNSTPLTTLVCENGLSVPESSGLSETSVGVPAILLLELAVVEAVWLKLGVLRWGLRRVLVGAER